MKTGLGSDVHGMIASRNQRLLGELDVVEAQAGTVTELEVLWHQLKFVVLEGDPAAYFRIRALFNEYRQGKVAWEDLKQHVFALFRSSLVAPLQESNIINLLTHIWGYLKKHVREEEDRQQALTLIRRLSDGDLSVAGEIYQAFSELHHKYGKADLTNPQLNVAEQVGKLEEILKK